MYITCHYYVLCWCFVVGLLHLIHEGKHSMSTRAPFFQEIEAFLCQEIEGAQYLCKQVTCRDDGAKN